MNSRSPKHGTTKLWLLAIMNSISNIIVFITIWFQFINSYIWLKLHIVFLVLLSFITWKHCHLQNLSLDFILTVILHWHSPHSLNISIINFQTISILSFSKISLLVIYYTFFSSPELKFKWAFLIKICPSFVIVVVVNFSHFHLLLQNHQANFNQTWHKASLGEGD